MEIYSFVSFGYDGHLVKIEADLKNGLPVTEIVGLPGTAVKEARERVRVAIKNSGFEYPTSRILINLCPADEKKEGSGFDLPIALSLLCAADKTQSDNSSACFVMGELELSGRVRKVCGVLAAVSAGLKRGIRYFIVPNENKAEAAIAENAIVFGVNDLTGAFETIKRLSSDDAQLSVARSGETTELHSPTIVHWSEPITENYREVKGQKELLSGLEIAAAGGHNLLAYGPPGCGKTLTLKKFASLLPDLDFKTSEEVTRIYSIAGLLGADDTNGVLIRRPPFRMPHQSASLEGIIGGAGKCLPGEISLAHGGVLFLDEAVQFKASVLQSLRVPLETGFVTLSRAEKRTSFPARFQLLLAMNPCECGNLGSENKFCTCAPQTIDRYWKKLTAPLLDRIDMRIFVLPPHTASLLSESSHSTEQMRKTVKAVYETSFERNAFYQKGVVDDYDNLKNAQISPDGIEKICRMTVEAQRAFEALSERSNFSGRGGHALLKIARTIADIEGLKKINTVNLEKAFLYRSFNPLLPDFL